MRGITRISIASVVAILLLSQPSVSAQQQPSVGAQKVAQELPQSDNELLHSAEFATTRHDKHYPYGLRPDHKTISPIYHLTSAGLYVWQNHLAPELVSGGGYTETNGEYFKALVAEHGGVKAFFLYFDRLVRNTRIGRHTTPKNERGLIEDSPQRYSPNSYIHKQSKE